MKWPGFTKILLTNHKIRVSEAFKLAFALILFSYCFLRMPDGFVNISLRSLNPKFEFSPKTSYSASLLLALANAPNKKFIFNWLVRNLISTDYMKIASNNEGKFVKIVPITAKSEFVCWCLIREKEIWVSP